MITHQAHLLLEDGVTSSMRFKDWRRTEEWLADLRAVHGELHPGMVVSRKNDRIITMEIG